MATQGLVSLLRLSYWELLNLPAKDRALNAELDTQHPRAQPEQPEKAYERQSETGAAAVTQGTILKKAQKRGKSSPTRSFGSGQRGIGGASHSLASAPAGISATMKHSVFIGRLGPSSLQVRKCSILRWVLRPPGNVSQGRWKRHQSPESDTQWRLERGVELHLETIDRHPGSFHSRFRLRPVP